MKTLFLITARGGSKGIPGKNIKQLGDKPLIAYSIDIARKFVADEFICVSTDSDEIINVVENYGLKVPFKRPDELANRITNRKSNVINEISKEWNVTNPHTTRCENRDKQYRGESTQNEQRKCGISGYSIGFESNSSRNSENENRWKNFPTKPPICGGDDGIPRELDSITFSKWRNESIKGYGNAIVPQVAHEIFKTIEKFENSL